MHGCFAGNVCLFTTGDFNVMFYKCITGNRALVLPYMSI